MSDWEYLREESRLHRQNKQNWSKELLEQLALDHGFEIKIIADWHLRLTKEGNHLALYPYLSSSITYSYELFVLL